MNRIIGAAGIAMAISVSSPAWAATDAECEVIRKGPGISATGKLSPAFSQAFTNSGRTLPADGNIDSATFLTACKAGVFAGAAATPEPGAPLPGANSYTEAQARGHIEKAGFTAVNGLKKDGQGIWHATATQVGKAVSVALDFKGNVVAN